MSSTLTEARALGEPETLAEFIDVPCAMQCKSRALLARRSVHIGEGVEACGNSGKTSASCKAGCAAGGADWLVAGRPRQAQQSFRAQIPSRPRARQVLHASAVETLFAGLVQRFQLPADTILCAALRRVSAAVTDICCR